MKLIYYHTTFRCSYATIVKCRLDNGLQLTMVAQLHRKVLLNKVSKSSFIFTVNDICHTGSSIKQISLTIQTKGFESIFDWSKHMDREGLEVVVAEIESLEIGLGR